MKTIILVFALLSFEVVMAQSSEISGKYDKIGKFEKGVAIVRLKDKVGVINSEGKEVIKPEYDKISAFGNDGIAYTRKKDQVGLINREGRIIADNLYDYIGHFKSGNAIIKKNGLSGVINREGRIIVDMKYDKLSCEEGGVIRATNADGTMTLIKPNN